MDLRNVQVEVDAAYLYGLLAEHEAEPAVAAIFREMSGIERGHALAFLSARGLGPEAMPPPSGRARTLAWVGRVLGYDYLLGVLLDTEKGVSRSVLSARSRQRSEARLSDTSHVAILRNILSRDAKIPAAQLARFEKRHRSVGGNALRAAVLGGNDGLVSNFSLVMGIAGATGGGREVLLTGIAGLLAGALSMALGEWISVRSSQELQENQMRLEAEELRVNPADEERELALIYRSKGIPDEQARQMAHELLADPEKAHATLVTEELGIRPGEGEGSAWEAAYTSFLLFALGAVIPVAPYFFTAGMTAVACSAALSAAGLFGIGAAITLFTGRPVWSSGLRQVLFGMLAAAITFAIGKWIGVNIAG